MIEAGALFRSISIHKRVLHFIEKVIWVWFFEKNVFREFQGFPVEECEMTHLEGSVHLNRDSSYVLGAIP